MYVVGGSLQQTWMYDVEADMWNELAPLPVELWSPTACSIEKDMYVIGGNNSNDMVYKSNSVNNTWDIVSRTFTEPVWWVV